MREGLWVEDVTVVHDNAHTPLRGTKRSQEFLFSNQAAAPLSQPGIQLRHTRSPDGLDDGVRIDVSRLCRSNDHRLRVFDRLERRRSRCVLHARPQAAAAAAAPSRSCRRQPRPNRRQTPERGCVVMLPFLLCVSQSAGPRARLFKKFFAHVPRQFGVRGVNVVEALRGKI